MSNDEKPLLFSAPMVRAILDGRKSQTRRIVNPQPQRRSPNKFGLIFKDSQVAIARNNKLYRPGKPIYCPYRAPGQKLWIKEACWMWGKWEKTGTNIISGRVKHRFVTIGNNVRFDKPEATVKRDGSEGWVYRHARFMPRWASRTTLTVNAIRVEQLQQISEADAQAEGVYSMPDEDQDGAPDAAQSRSYRAGFQYLWGEINGEKKPWSSNPLVWVIQFTKEVGQ